MPKVNITIEDDADFQYLFIYKVGGTPFDFTGGTLEMGVRRQTVDVTSILDLKMAAINHSGIYFDDAVNGRFVITILKEKLELIPPGDYKQSLILTKDGLRKPIWSGIMTIIQGPTR
jgi:hypothetical protein